MRTPLLTAATAAVTLALAGCSVLPQSPPPLPALPSAIPAHNAQAESSPAPPSATEVADGFSEEEHVAMRIRARTCDAFSVGTGFMLDEYTVVTNRHVVEGAQTITLTTYDGEQYEGTASVIADFADLALVTVDKPLEFAATIGADEPEAGDLLDIVGYPLGGPLNTRTGPFLGQVPDSLVEGSDDVDRIKVQAEHGNSGSAVYDADGDVVGVLYATDEAGDSFAVTLASLNTFLADTSLHLPNDTTCN
ncbi:S1 family peptidase [Demequina aurantiaca]|uniref:S1 family peptidase n=1 Tax=Demequina aurantiaca TaxID=676200 RepID=UPI003D34651C